MSSEPSTRRRKARLTAEALETRQLLTAVPAGGFRHSEVRSPHNAAIEARSASDLAPHPGHPAYDVAIRFSYVGAPGNASIGVDGFTPPTRATVPAQSTTSQGANYQEIGGVSYIYAIGQTEVTAGQYVTFLNKVDPSGSDPVQPVTGVQLWTSAFSPVTDPFSGQINLVQNAAPGTHYQLAAPYWANKPLVNGNMLDFAYFDNSLYNGSTVAIDNSHGESPLGYRVHQQTRYVNLSTNISTGMYNLQDSNYYNFGSRSQWS